WRRGWSYTHGGEMQVWVCEFWPVCAPGLGRRLGCKTCVCHENECSVGGADQPLTLDDAACLVKPRRLASRACNDRAFQARPPHRTAGHRMQYAGVRKRRCSKPQFVAKRNVQIEGVFEFEGDQWTYHRSVNRPIAKDRIVRP